MLPYFYEGVFEAPVDFENPPRDAKVIVELTSPSGRVYTIPAFWDGGRIWRFRYSPEEVGVWQYRIRPSHGQPKEWLGAEGDFAVRPYAGPNPLYRHGPVGVSPDGPYLAHRDGTPFFWLADTAWNGVLKADPADWERYLEVRREQGFTVTQVVMTDWRAFFADREGERAYEGRQGIRINPRFFRRLDRKVEAVARSGLLPCLVVLWALTGRDPGNHLPEEDAVLLGRYIVSRYAGYRCAWFLGGDGRYEDVERWRRIGRAVFAEFSERGLATVHPCGSNWTGDAFGDEPWCDFIGYQSSHGPDERAFDWIVHGPPAREWRKRPGLPVINLEPCYEAHVQGGTSRRFTPHDVRIALYLSLLVSPTAGVSYGHNGIWPWSEHEESPLTHRHTGVAPPWHEALTSEGAYAVTCLRRFFDGVAWWRLRPAPELVAEQPGGGEGRRWVAASCAEDGGEAVIYIPYGGEVALETARLAGAAAFWYNPRTGERRPAEAPSGGRQLYRTPDEEDWVLHFKASS